MKTRWTQANNQIVIEQGMPLAARLFALPLLFIAAYLGLQFVGALWDLVLAFSLRAWLDSAIGLVVLAVLLLAFALPGLFLLLSAKRVMVDAHRHEVIEEMRWLTLARRQRYSTETFRAVRISYEVGTGSHDSDQRAVLFTFDVTLVDAQNRSKLLAMFATSELLRARALAQDISTLLNLKLSDRSGKWDPALARSMPADHKSPG